MMTTIEGVLSPETLARLRALAADTPFHDGRETASGCAREVKHNLQMRPDAPAAQEAAQILAGALLQNQALRAFAMPAAMQPPRLVRYTEGMRYGYHVDAAFMGDPAARADLSATLFLSDPASYDGGELVIDGPWGRFEVKLAAGSLVLYPATTLHRVAPVTRGERLVAITWIQSRVRSAEQREILIDLERLRARIAGTPRDDEAPALVSKVRENLIRLWFGP